jgi:hypothetical protein
MEVMLSKIVSGGQTGADRAALDAAIQLDIAHGGWVPKGRLAEDGPIPEHYQLREMPSASYPKRTEQNVIDSDGTVIFSRGKLTGGSDYTREMALRHNKTWLHVDLNRMSEFKAAEEIITWVQQNRIAVLNVAGPRASNDPKIYAAVMKIIETAYYLHLTREGFQAVQTMHMPRTVAAAVDDLTTKIPLKERILIANMRGADLANLEFSLGAYIRDNYGLLSGNTALIADCRSLSKTKSLQPDESAGIILRQLWQKLRETHRLRRVK